MTNFSLSRLSDSDLIANFRDLLIEERERLVALLEHLVELDRRKLFFHYASLRAYLVQEHGMEEKIAERRIRLARLLRRFPTINGKLESGKLNQTLLEIAMGCAHREKLPDSELGELIESISGMSCKSAEREVASRFPQSTELPGDRIRPINSEFYEVRFVANDELMEKIEEIRGLLAHSHPGISMAELIDILATEYRTRHHPEEKAKRATERDAKKKQTEEVKTPTAPWVGHSEETRAPSQSLLHELTRKNGYVCSYIDPVTQKRCTSRHGLEIDHVQEWSKGGKTKLTNLRFICRNHHRRVSFLQFGESSKYFKPKEE